MFDNRFKKVFSRADESILEDILGRNALKLIELLEQGRISISRYREIALEIKIDNGPVRLYLIDSNGRLIKEIINKNLTSGIHRIRYNAGKLKNGLYFIKLQNNKSKFSRSIIKYN